MLVVVLPKHLINKTNTAGLIFLVEAACSSQNGLTPKDIGEYNEIY